MAKKSASLLFPFQEDLTTGSLVRATTVNETISSAIKCFLLTEKGQRRGNAVGSFLPTLQHKLIPEPALAGFADELKTELTKQFPGVIFTRVDLTKDLQDNQSNLRVTLEFGTALSDISQLELLIQ